MPSTFILASASPRRRDLLAAVGLEPEIRPSHVDETPYPDERPVPYAIRVAGAKAEAGPMDQAVLAADTVVALGDTIMGKAVDPEDARRMLGLLSGQTHTVYTAVALRAPVSNRFSSAVVATRVRFRHLSASEIARYVDTKEPMDKAGAYGIQGLGGALVASVKGSYTNVVGLPVEETLSLLCTAWLL